MLGHGANRLGLSELPLGCTFPDEVAVKARRVQASFGHHAIASLPRSVHVRQSMLTDLQLVLDFRQHPDRSCAGYSDGEMY